ncbi:hypothetical protein WR25_01257 isoform B [Diploscapter pachys]|uniref:Glycoside hydrolase 35 catalytic domain-containing protein n=1 Tax=Diploscapter pachys TaxID=2018661 RepID=A0A2A2LXS6_9BILA|nr:hypothetical protein WR25_01257 isoform B [Diploscapter pachys]
MLQRVSILLLSIFAQILIADRSFYIDYANNQFVRDGKPFRYISGSIHYFRTLPDQWEERLKAIRAAGLNAIQTYIPWNFHETFEGNYNFDGQKNFTRFFEIAGQNDLAVIVRPGPYICGEWENGGLPYWLIKNPAVKLRSSETNYLTAALKWWGTILPMLKPQLWNNGGPIIMTQLENEYGSYGCDKAYKNALRDKAVSLLGNDAVLFTTDPPEAIECGKTEGVFATVDFGERGLLLADEYFAIQRLANNKSGPLVNSEYYPVKQMISMMYEKGASFNFYMFHGGTNFQWWNGAEYAAGLITSYDYLAPMTEAGGSTDKYDVVRDFIGTLSNWDNKPLNKPKDPEMFSQQGVALQKMGNLHDYYNLLITQTNVSETPISFEDGTLSPNYHPHRVSTLLLPSVSPGDELELIVENQGRLTWETTIDHKGLIGNSMMINDQKMSGVRDLWNNTWKVSTINLDNILSAVQQPSVSFMQIAKL